MDALRAELAALAAENIATQALLFVLLTELRDQRVMRREVLLDAFEQAVLLLETAAIRVGQPQAPTHVPRAMQIVEQLREQFLASEQPPDDAVED